MLDRQEKIYIALLMLIAGAWAVFILRPILYDEAFNFLIFSGQPLKKALADYSFPNNHLLYTLLSHISQKLCGDEPWALRLPALLAGIGLIPVNYLLARRLFDRHTAVLSSALLTGSSIVIEFAASARGYSLLILFSLLVFYALTGALENRRKAWAGFAVAASLGFYTIPIMAYCLYCALIWFILSAWTKYRNQPPPRLYLNMAIAVTAAAALTGLLYLPVLLNQGWSAVAANRFVLPQTFAVFLNSIWPLFQETWQSWHRGIPTALTVVTLCVSLYAFLNSDRLRRQGGPLLTALLLGTVSMLFITRHTPYSRTLLFLLPFYLQLVAAGITEVIARFGQEKALRSLPLLSLGLAAVTVIAVVRSPAIRHSQYQANFNDAPRLVAQLHQYLKPDDKLISFCPADANIFYYSTLYRLPLENIRYNYRYAKRLVLVLLKTQDINFMVDRYGGPPVLKDLRQAKVIIETDETRVYLFE